MDDEFTIEDLGNLRDLLGKFLKHIEVADPSEESHPLVRAAGLTYAFVNATAQHQGV